MEATISAGKQLYWVQKTAHHQNVLKNHTNKKQISMTDYVIYSGKLK